MRSPPAVSANRSDIPAREAESAAVSLRARMRRDPAPASDRRFPALESSSTQRFHRLPQLRVFGAFGTLSPGWRVGPEAFSNGVDHRLEVFLSPLPFRRGRHNRPGSEF